MTDVEIAWLAGILEGEGSFLFAPPSAYSTGVIIVASMTDEDVIARIARLLGTTYRKEKERDPRWKPAYITTISGRRAAEMMRLLLPHMGSRRSERIRAVLASIDVKAPTPKVTADVQCYINAEHARGASARQIARALGVHHNTVCRALARSTGLQLEGRAAAS